MLKDEPEPSDRSKESLRDDVSSGLELESSTGEGETDESPPASTVDSEVEGSYPVHAETSAM